MYDKLKEKAEKRLSAGYDGDKSSVCREASLTGIGYAILALAEAIKDSRKE